MKQTSNQPLVSTVRERCRVCYTCVRECPAKAIRISGGQAQVIVERCIGCGNCVRVCSQKAKQVMNSIEEVERLLASGRPVAACIAPSFPAEFFECDDRRLIGMLHALGFSMVNEVGFGADLVARRYARMLEENPGRRYIATTCPAVVAYVERYHPDSVPDLIPIVSPMIATARALRSLHGPEIGIVFIGPCIAKKAEAAAAGMEGEVNAALTFAELREMFVSHGIAADAVTPGAFDPPLGGTGSLFPISRGLLQAAKINEDLMLGDVVAANGRSNFVEAIREFETGDLDARLLEVLCCNGCIMGPGITNSTPLFSRRSRVSRYVQKRQRDCDPAAAEAEIARYGGCDLTRDFHADDQRFTVPSRNDLVEILSRMGKNTRADELDCGACGYDTCYEHAVAIYKGFAESEMCLPYTIDQLRKTVQELAVSNEQLADTQEALMHSERLASMGQLAAGIAHEVNNPLGVVLMYAHLLLDDCDARSAIRDDVQVIVEQTDRCKKIVAGLLNFARQNKLAMESVDLHRMVDHVMKTMPAPSGVRVRVVGDGTDPVCEIDADQITQVLTNLIQNAYAAMPSGGDLVLGVSGDSERVRISITDTGIGIPKENISKIFEPFFTTKQIGKGTGLGLAVSYGIVKMHRGELQVDSNADPAAGPTGTTFCVTLPRKGMTE
jgi:nitrogen-specific signal transduction histidine kinase/iron only hydrogenase large subunit-like protein